MLYSGCICCSFFARKDIFEGRIPKSVLSDNGLQFTVEMFVKLLSRNGIKGKGTPVYHPAELFNREIMDSASCH